MSLATPWTSVHRYADGFDLVQAGDGGPEVIVVVMTPAQPTAHEAIAAVSAGVTGDVTSSFSTLAGAPCETLDIDGGTGQLAASSEGGIALDAAPAQRVRAFAADLLGEPVLVMVLVPDGSHWDAGWELASELLASLSVPGIT